MVQWYKYQLLQCQKTIKLLIKGNRYETMETKKAKRAEIIIKNIYTLYTLYTKIKTLLQLTTQTYVQTYFP